MMFCRPWLRRANRYIRNICNVRNICNICNICNIYNINYLTEVPHAKREMLGQRDLYCNGNSEWGGLVFVPLAKWYLYINGNHKRRVASVGNETSGRHLSSRDAAALAWRGALSSSPSLIPINQASSTNITVTYSSSRYWWVTLCDQ